MTAASTSRARKSPATRHWGVSLTKAKVGCLFSGVLGLTCEHGEGEEAHDAALAVVWNPATSKLHEADPS